jgi:cation transport regulator ChaC
MRKVRGDMVKSELVFAYGSNMDPAQMRERCPESDLSWFVAEARGWKLCFPRASIKRQGGVGSLVRGEGSSTWGVVFAVSERDLVRLDQYEGVSGEAYRRDIIQVHDQNGRELSAITYFAVPDGKGEHVPHKDYIELYVRGAVYFGLPAEYLERRQSIKKGAKR